MRPPKRRHLLSPVPSNTIVIPALYSAFGRSLRSYQTNGDIPANAWYRCEPARLKAG
jgi:hypothetical protein